MRSRNSLSALTRAWLLVRAVALMACALPAAAGAAATPVTPTSLTDCGGSVSPDRGGAAADEPNLLDYKFSCDGGIIAFAGDGVKRAGPKVRTGALVLSRYAHRGKTVTTAYTPYSLLRSLEDMLRYTPLARATAAPSFATAALVQIK